METGGDDIPVVEVPKTSLAELLSKSSHDTVTVVGIVYEIQEIQDVSCRDGKARKKQVVTVVDDSSSIVHITLREGCTGVVEDSEGEVVEFRNMEIKDFRGKRSLSSGPLSTFLKTHQVGDGHWARLKEW